MDTIDAILQAAYDRFSRGGYERTPVSDIAKDAGVAAGTIIYHFKTKDNLLRVLNWFTLSRLHAQISAQTREAPHGLAAVTAYVDAFFTHLEANGPQISLLMETFAHAPVPALDETSRNMDVSIRTVRHGLGTMLESFMAQGLDDGSMAPVDVHMASLGLLAMLMGSARLVLFHDTPLAELHQAAQAHVRALLSPAS